MLHESQIPRSCDRCYIIKERCEWTRGIPKCERCTRVGHACESKRPMKRPGRPPAPYLQSGARRTRTGGAYCKSSALSKRRDSTTVTTHHTTTGWQNALSSIGDLTRQDVALIDQVISNDDFTKKAVLGPTFFQDYRQKLVLHLLSSSGPVIMDGFLAMSLAWGDEMLINNSFKHATLALQKLQSFTIKDRLDLTTCILLGWQILHFALNASGGQPLEICSQTLSLIKPHYGPNLESSYTTFLTSIAFTEIVECLLQTRMPTLRVDAENSTLIDGCVGLCTTLLPHIYDLAVINYEMYTRSQGTDNASQDVSDLLERLEDIKHHIRHWKPPIPEDFCAKYTSTEVAHMMCQTHATQTSALLIAHRLQYPFGVEDGVALALASTILSHLDLTIHVTKKSAKCVDMSLIVACLEIEDEANRAKFLRSFSAIGSYSTIFQERINDLTSQVWKARRQRQQSQLYWYHLGEILAQPL